MGSSQSHCLFQDILAITEEQANIPFRAIMPYSNGPGSILQIFWGLQERDLRLGVHAAWPPDSSLHVFNEILSLPSTAESWEEADMQWQ